MKTLIFTLFIVSVLFLFGCSAQREAKIIPPEEMGDMASLEALSEPSREAVFVYSKQADLGRSVILKLGGEPRLFSSGYVRLAGVVSGGSGTACIEIGGRGLALKKGEKIDDYRIVRIESDHVVLAR